MQQRLRRRAGVQRQVERAGEVVAGAQGEQPQGAAAELAALVEGLDDRVQAPVAAGDHDAAAPGAVQDPVELAGVGGAGHLDVGLGAQHLQGLLEGVALTAAGLGVGDHQKGVHARTLAPGG